MYFSIPPYNKLIHKSLRSVLFCPCAHPQKNNLNNQQHHLFHYLAFSSFPYNKAWWRSKWKEKPLKILTVVQAVSNLKSTQNTLPNINLLCWLIRACLLEWWRYYFSWTFDTFVNINILMKKKLDDLILACHVFSFKWRFPTSFPSNLHRK